MKSLDLARRLKRQKVAEASGNIATAYFGPEIDAGYSYGKFICSSCGFEQLSNKGEMIHCVNCGAPSKFKTTASFKAVKKVTKEVTSEFYCPTCGSFTVSSSTEAAKDPKEIFCPQCGSSMEILGEDTMIPDSEESSEITSQGKDIDVIEDEGTTEESTGAMDIDVIEDESTAEMIDDENEEEESTITSGMKMQRNRDIDVIEDESTAEMMEDTEDIKIDEEESEAGYGEESYDTAVTGLENEDDIEVVKDNEGEEPATTTDEENELEKEETTGMMDEEGKEGQITEEETTSANIEVIDDESTEEKPSSTAMVQYLTPISKDDTFTANDVQMAFYNGNNDPAWTVLIKGSPVATIKLSDQPRAQEIAELFTKDEYAQNVAKALIECGPKEVLDQVKARYFANKIEESALATQIYEKVKAELANAQKTALATMKEDFKSCIATVLAGMNRNFWKDTENPLKGALFVKLHDELGISDPTSIIESAFEASANTYFDIVLSKAIEFMGKTPEAREEIAQAISGSNTTIGTTAGFIPAAKRLAQRLENNNVVAQVTGSGLSGKDKNNIKNIIRLGKAY
jgi:predicted RNA-binding Zn-ribbon protein involved in translation (DUF1610 family)